jgi:Lantibiotic dehydratase, N terminus
MRLSFSFQLVSPRWFRFAATVSSAYRIASPFLVRLAGVPFDSLEKLTTPHVSRAAREIIRHQDELLPLRRAAWKFILSRESSLTRAEANTWRKALRHAEVPGKKIPEQLRDFAAATTALKAAKLQMAGALDDAVAQARRALFDVCTRFLPAYLVFGSGEVHHLMDAPLAIDDLPARNSQERKRERHLLLYLQRIAAKNDTFSEFGPCAWVGREQPATGLKFEARPGVAQRETFLERWCAHALAAVLNADAEIFPELRPRLNPNGRLVANRFIATDRGKTVELTPEQMEIVARCDGQTPVRELVKCPEIGDETELVPSNHESQIIHDLVSKEVLIAAIEVPAMEPFAFEILRQDIGAWRNETLRKRWLAVADALAELAGRFGQTSDVSQRNEIMTAARDRLASLGAERKAGERALYAAANPIAEECHRECRFELSEALLDEVVTAAEPWIDFWRDSYAFIAARVAANLRALLEKAPAKNLPLPAFLRFCENAKIPLTGPGLVGMAHIAFQEVKAAFRERLRPHSEKAEYELTAEDCAVVRKNFTYPKFDEFTYPSADLQLAAESVDAVNRGEYRWIIGELHPAAATLHHCMWWSCPDKPALSRALQSMIHDKLFFHFGFFAADFTAHTTVRVFDALPQQAIFVSPQRANPGWRYVAPAETEVFIDDEGDVALRCGDEYLGSFARNWVIPLGFHPFLFTIAPHTPRLRCGRVIVQRRAWSVSAEELGAGDFSGLSADLVIAIERLRAAKDWPRFIYIRPSEQALRRSGAENRDKDTKPVFIDLESYLFLEIFHRWLSKAGELEITEMLPAPDELLWKEADGRRTFELRTLICPR